MRSKQEKAAPARRSYRPNPLDRPETVVERSSFSTAAERPLKGVLLNTISGMDAGGMIRQSMALDCWEMVVGQQAAAASHAESVRDGILFVCTRSSVWSHELTLHKQRIITGINRVLGGKVIEDIIYRARGVPAKTTEVETPLAPSQEILDAVILEQFELQELNQLLDSCSTITDERARAAVTSRAIREAKLRHWRLERGWRVCVKCNAVHNTKESECPLCKLHV